uniref:Uncharacterized protein n=1 Tax=Triticum urartu TaxID=4572 RepID=A0A8R7TIZ2_TRIUA
MVQVNRLMHHLDGNFVESICAPSLGLLPKIQLATSLPPLEIILIKQSFKYVSLVCISISLFIGLFILEIDCSFVVSFLAHDTLNRLSLVDLKKKALVITKPLPNFKPAKINKQAN